jgi:hypothetical protein
MRPFRFLMEQKVLSKRWSVCRNGPCLKGKDLVFSVKVIEGELPAEGGPVVMFIDPIGRPLSPGSIAGVHRRHRRRAIMRH